LHYEYNGVKKVTQFRLPYREFCEGWKEFPYFVKVDGENLKLEVNDDTGFRMKPYKWFESTAEWTESGHMNPRQVLMKEMACP